MNKRLAGLSDEEQRTLLAQVLRKKTTKLKKKPLSFAQERLWFLYQLDPGNSAHNTFNAIRLSGTLNGKVLEECFNQVVARHETLRTTFTSTDGKVVQVIASTLELSLPLIQLGETPHQERQARMERMAAEEAQRPFDLTHGPLVRPTLLRLTETEHILFLAVHHIISDGWSAGILFQEMMTIYKAKAAGSLASPLPALHLQYADFAVWQRDWLQGEMLANQQAYWQKQLENLSALELPTDHERPALTSVRGATCTWILSPKLTNELKSISQRTGMSLFMLLLAGFTTLLYRYSGHTDVAVRTPIANRMRKELEGLIGYFVNTLVLRTDLSGVLTFRELLGRVEQICRGAYEHQDIPFEKILEDLHLAQHAGGWQGSLFPVMFILQNAPLPLPDVPGLQCEILELNDGLAPFELTMALREVKGGIRCRLTYCTDLFERASMERMMIHFEQVLQRAVADIDQGFGSLLECIPAEEIPVVRFQARRITEYIAPRTPLEKTLAGIWKEILGIEQIGIQDNFFELGGDSLLSMRMVALANKEALHLTPKQISQHQILAELAAAVNTGPEFQAEQAPVTGLVPLTCDQYWYLYRATPHRIQPERWNSSVFLQVPPALCEDGKVNVLEQAVQAIWKHHDALRARFVHQESAWRQYLMSPEEINPFSRIDLSGVRDAEITVAIQTQAEQLQGSLNFADGPLFRVAAFDLGRHRPGRLLIIAHHLVIDGFSLQILLKDLQECYLQLSQGRPAQLPPKTVSIRQWAELLHQYAQSATVYQELDYWLNLPWADVLSLPVDDPDGYRRDSVPAQQSMSIDFTSEETTLILRDISTFYQTSPLHILLTALTQTIGHWTGGQAVEITCPMLGRDILPQAINIDLSRTVGFLVLSKVLVLRKVESDNLLEALHEVEAQVRQAPNQSCGYHFLSDLRGDAEITHQLKPLRKDELLFNYLGQMQSADAESTWLSPAPEYPGDVQDPRQRPYHLLAAVGSIFENKLTFRWIYSPHLYRPDTIAGLAQFFKERVLAFIQYYQDDVKNKDTENLGVCDGSSQC